jgi:hypothetical protein
LRDQIVFLKGDGKSHLKTMNQGGHSPKKNFRRRKYGKRK